MGKRAEELQAQEGQQVAALPLRSDPTGKIRVLMVTSRDTGRWVLPKGWTMEGKKDWRAAEIEALEEAGAEGSIRKTPLGAYRYSKAFDDGPAIDCLVIVYPMIVSRLKRRWKERRERTRRWFGLKSAARRVDEPELAALLRDLARRSRKMPSKEAEILRKL